MSRVRQVTIFIIGVRLQIRLPSPVPAPYNLFLYVLWHVFGVDQKAAHENEHADFVPVVHVPIRIKVFINIEILWVFSENDLIQPNSIKTGDKGDYSHIDILLDKYLSEAVDLLLNFGMLLLEFTHYLKKDS